MGSSSWRDLSNAELKPGPGGLIDLFPFHFVFFYMVISHFTIVLFVFGYGILDHL